MRSIGYVALFSLCSLSSPLASECALTATEINQRIIGNTIVGMEDGKYYEEFLNPNGMIEGRTKSERYKGYWRIEGNRLCFGYESRDDESTAKDWTCTGVGLSGSQLIWNDNGDVSCANLVKGRIK